MQEIAGEAVEAIRVIGIDAGRLRKRYVEGESGEKRLTIMVAGLLKEEKLSGLVREGLSSNDWQVRREAAIALSRIGEKSNGGALLAALKQEKVPEVSSAIAYALGAIKETGGVRPLSELVKANPDHPYKKEIVRSIGRIGGNSSAVALKPFLKDMDPWVRQTAVAGLEESGAKVRAEDVRHLLADDLWLNRAGAARAMAVGGDDGSLDILVRLLDDDHPAVRATAHHGLKSWKDAKAIPAVLQQIETLGGDGRGMAFDILKSLTKQDYATATEWKRWWELNRGNFRMPPIEERFAPQPLKGRK